MTFKEKLLIEHPEYTSSMNYSEYGCPSDHEYEDKQNFCDHCTYLESCEECWDREMEE